MRAFVQIIALIVLWSGMRTIHAQTQIGADVYGLVAGSEAGSSVAISANGMRMICGSHEHLGERGMVRIYEYNTTTSTWDLMQDIIGAATDDEFGYAVDISADGNRIVVGAPQFSKPTTATTNNEGFFSIYEYNGVSWTLRSTVIGDAAVDRLGTSVAISDDGTTVAAGAMWHDDGTIRNVGHTQIYRYNGAAWVQLGVDINGTDFGENSGYDIDLSQNGATIIIGSWGYEGSLGLEQGGARIYDWNGSAWVLRGAIIEGANVNDHAGMAVAISTNGNRIAIGAPWTDAIATDAGHARIFDWNGSAWTQVGATLTGVDANDWFGHSLDFNGDDQIAIGAPFANNPAGTTEVYCYNTTRGEWVQVGGDDILGSPASGDGSGYAVAIARDTNIIAVGAPSSSDFAANAGRVRVFELDNPAMRLYGNNTLIENGDISPATTDDTDFGGVSIVGGIVSHTFTIENAALNANLLLNGAPTIAITGAHTSDFTVTVMPTTSLSACGDVTTFTIAFSPSAVGLREATVSIANNTTGQNPYTFSIQGIGGEPATGLVFDGSGDYVNFNSIADDMVGKTAFTIQAWVNATSNSGIENIFLASRPGSFLVASISIVEFYLINGVLVIETGGRTINTGVNIANTGWRQITVTNDASRIVLYIDGQYTMEESVSNAFAFRVNDRWRLGRNTSNTFPYYFTGTLDEVRVWDRALCPTEILGNINCELMGNEANLMAYYKLNQGLRGLSNTSVDTMVDMTSNANTGNLFNFSLTGTNSNWGEGNPTVSSTTCTATSEPEIEVSGNGITIADGDITPAIADDTHFGATVASSPITKTFTINNTGLGSLELFQNISITGVDVADFTITTPPASTTLAASTGTTTFTVSFDPTGFDISTRTATINIFSTDCDETVYSFDISGDAIGLPATGLTFDNMNAYIEINSVANDMVGKTEFTMEAWVNSLATTDNDAVVACNGSGNGDVFQLVLRNGVLNIKMGATFYSTGILIANTGWRHVATTYDGTKAIVYLDGIYVAEYVGTVVPFAANHRWSIGQEFDNITSDRFSGTMDEVRIWDRALCITEIRRHMNCELMGSETNLMAYYQLNQGYIGMNNTVDTAIDLTANNNTGNLLNFALTGNTENWNVGNTAIATTTCIPVAAQAEMEVRGNGTVITDGDITPSLTDDTNLGTGSAALPTSVIFTINNTGLAPLELAGNLTITGVNAVDFAVTAQPTLTTIPIGGNTTFTVQFVPTGLDVSTRTATVNIVSTDCDETLYNFDISGDAIGLPATGLTFDNTNAYIEINSVADDMVGKTEFTMEAWVNSLATTDNDAVVACNGSGNGDVFQLVLRNGVLNIKMGATFYSTGILIANTGWRHVATTYDGTKAIVYLDGIYVAEYVGIVVPFAANHRWSIGQEFDNNTSDRFFGTMDEVRIWDRALCAAEILGQMNCELMGSEANLMAYYQLNQGYIGMNNTVDTAIDLTTNNNTGNLLNFALTGNTENWNVGNTAIATTPCLAVGLPEIEVTGNSTSIADGSTIVSLIDHTEFESATLSGGILSTTRTYTISNTSASDMYIASLNITGVNAADFTITNNPAPMTLVGGASISFTVTFNPTVTGFKNATINIVSTDCDETLYSFDIGARALGIFSDVRGQMISLNGTNEYINVNGTAAEMLGATQFTIESWIKPNAAQNNNDCIFTINRNGGGDIFVFYLDDGILTIEDANGINSFGTTDLRGTGWHHVAVTFDNSNFIVYLDGVQQGSVLAGAIDPFANDNRWSIGHEFNFNFFGLLSRNHFRGELDEVRVWRDVRTQQEIREQMHISLTGVEDNLAAYFQFDNDAGNTVNDGIGNNGTAINTPTYFASEVAVGGGVSNTQNVLAAATTYDFVGTDLEITFTGTVPGNEVVVSKIETQNPYNESTGILANNTAGYWVVNNYGNNTGLNAAVKFNYNNGSVTDNTPSNHIVHKRGSRDWNTTDWIDLVATAVSTTVGDNHVRIDGITSFSQLDVTAIRSSLPVELLHFDAKRQNNEEVLLEWSTANEINNQSFEIERMLENETEFTVVGLVAGNGTTVRTSYYDLIDDNSYTNVTYYRLKQYDFDGSISYSETRAVEGVEILTTNQMNISIYPNPVTNNSLKIRFDELPENVHNAAINISNINGQILYQNTEEVQSYQVLPIQYVNQLTPAVYFIQIRLDNGEYRVEKFIKK